MCYLRKSQIAGEHIKCDPLRATDKRIAKKSKDIKTCCLHTTQTRACAVPTAVSQMIASSSVRFPSRLGATLNLPAPVCTPLFHVFLVN